MSKGVRAIGMKSAWEDVRVRRILFLLLLILAGLLAYALNAYTPLQMDDYDYSFSWATGERLSGVGDVIASQAAHYRLWGGRSVTHTLAQLFLYWGKPVFNAANAVMYVCLLLEIYALARRRETQWDWRLILIAHVCLLIFVPFFGTVFLWLDGACNYLWGTVLALLPLVIIKSEREGGFFAADDLRGLLAALLCFAAGWTNENTACGVLAALILLLIRDYIKGRRVRTWRIGALIAQTAGVLLMLLAPGNFARAAEESSRGFVMEMIYRFAVVSFCLVMNVGALILLLLLMLAAARRQKTALRSEWLCLLGAAALLCAYALVGSPQISDRSFTGVLVLVIAALLAAYGDRPPVMNKGAFAAGAALVLLGAAVGLAAVEDVKAHGEAWLAQVETIEASAAAGEDLAMVSSVPSASRFTMDIALSEDPGAWPNSTLYKYFGIRVSAP